MPKKQGKDTDYLFLSAALRVRESRMLSRDRLARVIEAPDYAHAAKLLTECGYPDLSDVPPQAISRLLEKHRHDILNELAGHKAARPIVDIFRAKYDYYNIKTLVRAASADADAEVLLSDCGRVPAAVLSEAFAAEELGGLPPEMKGLIREATRLLSGSGRPQILDILIDRAYFAEIRQLSHGLGDGHIRKYVKMYIDIANLKTVVRILRRGAAAPALADALIPGGSVTAADADGTVLLSRYAAAGFREAAGLGLAVIGGAPYTAFERACDNALSAFMGGSRIVGFGMFPVLAYLYALEWEIMTVRILLSGKRLGLDTETIRERLRDCHVS